jgi:general L-amino acid transport system permease protein
MAIEKDNVAFVRTEILDEAPPPNKTSGVAKWIWDNILESMTNFSTIPAAIVSILMIILTFGAAYLTYILVEFIVSFGFMNAVWEGTDRAACATEAQGGVKPDGWFGACWAYVGAYFGQFIYGRYPLDELWRVNLVFVLFFAGLVPMLIPSIPRKRETIIYMAIIFPLLALILLTGGGFEFEPRWIGSGGFGYAVEFVILSLIVAGLAALWAKGTAGDPVPAAITTLGVMAVIGAILLLVGIDFGLEHVETEVWGGLLMTLVIAVTGIAVSLPLGILLALGRRSDMPIVRAVSVVFIEFWRGIPLITVLFMSSVMLPLFLPEGVTFDKLLRALIGVALFSAAYMAEVIRGGLQAIPKGQYEGAMAVGLTFWQSMRMIILPQALKLVIPGIVNTFIGLFKDTTLVLIIGLFDFLGMIQSSFTDASWSTPVQSLTGYLFAAFVFWVFCFAMSRYSIYTERRLHTGH